MLASSENTLCLVYDSSAGLQVTAGPETELCVGTCAALLAQWAHSSGSHGNRDSLRMFILKSVLRRAMSQVKG